MKRLILAIAVIATLSGCATRSQTAALAGVVTGAVIANEVNRNEVHRHAPPPPPAPAMRCYNRLIGYDYYHRAVYQQVCSTY